MKQETTNEKTQISDKMGVSKGYELARFRSQCFEKHTEFYKCFSYACLMSTSNQSHFQLQWEVMASLYFTMLYFTRCTGFKKKGWMQGKLYNFMKEMSMGCSCIIL